RSAWPPHRREGGPLTAGRPVVPCEVPSARRAVSTETSRHGGLAAPRATAPNAAEEIAEGDDDRQGTVSVLSPRMSPWTRSTGFPLTLSASARPSSPTRRPNGRRAS